MFSHSPAVLEGRTVCSLQVQRHSGYHTGQDSLLLLSFPPYLKCELKFSAKQATDETNSCHTVGGERGESPIGARARTPFRGEGGIQPVGAKVGRENLWSAEGSEETLAQSIRLWGGWGVHGGWVGGVPPPPPPHVVLSC